MSEGRGRFITKVVTIAYLCVIVKMRYNCCVIIPRVFKEAPRKHLYEFADDNRKVSLL